MITLVVKDKEYKWKFSYDVVDVLKQFAKFDSTQKKWFADFVPCWAAKYLSISESECVDVKWWRGYAYINRDIPQHILERETCYELERWKMEDGRATKVKEKICLSKKTERGDIMIARGLVSRIAKVANLRITDFASSLRELEPHEGLRDYQVEVARNLWAQLRKVGCGTIMMATGAGKSFLAGYLAKQLERSGYAVILTALQVDLVNQMLDHAKRFGASNVYGVTIQTLYRRLLNSSVIQDAESEEDKELIEAYADEMEVGDEIVKIAERKDVAVILDEAHHVPARTVKEVMSKIGDGWALRVGLTATPWRNDGRDLEIYAVLGDVVEPRVTSSYLIERGYAVPVEIRITNVPRCPHQCNGNGASAYNCIRKSLVECSERNRLITDLTLRSEKPVLVVTKLIKHAEVLYKLLRATGSVRVALATGAVKGEERKRIYDMVRHGMLDVLVATTIAEEGLDLPPLRTMILALADKSKTKTLQRAGRLVRPWPGKTLGVLYELRDDVEYFDEHLEERLRLYAYEPRWRIVEYE